MIFLRMKNKNMTIDILSTYEYNKDNIEKIEKEERLQSAIDAIRTEFGFTSLLKGNALDQASRTIARSKLIGGHSAGGLDGLK